MLLVTVKDEQEGTNNTTRKEQRLDTSIMRLGIIGLGVENDQICWLIFLFHAVVAGHTTAVVSGHISTVVSVSQQR